MLEGVARKEPVDALPLVLAHIVTYNHSSSIERAVLALSAQEGFALGANLHIQLTDNASSDDTYSVLQKLAGPGISVTQNTTNVGFSGAHNAGAARAVALHARYLFVLNPDIALEPCALKLMVAALETDPSAGAACPKLLRAGADLKPVMPLRLDAAGMYMTPALRHLDRGSEELDKGQFDADAYVFGGSGAALLLRMETVLDVALQSTAESGTIQLFDDAFFAYREDADLAWRLQWRGWSTRYVAGARGAHIRHVLPERRSQLAPVLNRLGVRNRFLLQLNNLSPALAASLFPFWLIRNVVVLAAVLLRERSSIAGLREAWRLRSRARRNRQETLSAARVSSTSIRKWFAFTPQSLPALLRAETPSEINSINIVIVNFNSGDRLERAVAAACAAVSSAEAQFHLTIIDNASIDNSASRLVDAKAPTVDIQRNGVNIRVIFSSSNLGFAGGVNRGAREFETDALLIMNPDLELRPDTLPKLAAALCNYPSLGMVSPVLVGRDGAVQHGFTARRFPSIKATLAELFFLHKVWPENPWTKAYRLQDDMLLRSYLEQEETALPHHPRIYPVVVEQPAGACLLIRTSVFQQLNGFDETFWPAWFEDVDFAVRLRRTGALAAVVGSARADHEGGYSLSYLSASSFSEAWYTNLLRYWRKTGSRAERLSLRALLPIALLLRSGIIYLESVRLWMHRRPEEAKRKRGHATTLFQLSLRR